MINSSRANLSLELLSFFLQNDSLGFSSTSTFHLCISLVYFTVGRGDFLNLPKFYRGECLGWPHTSYGAELNGDEKNSVAIILMLNHNLNGLNLDRQST